MPMNDYFSRFAAAPASFKKSFAMLALAWACHPAFLYSLFQGRAAIEGADQGILKMAVVSLCLVLLLFLIKPWARALVVVGNLLMVVYDLFFYLALAPQTRVTTLLCVAVVLFTVSGTYWLFVRASRDYFSQLNPKAGNQTRQGA